MLSVLGKMPLTNHIGRIASRERGDGVQQNAPCQHSTSTESVGHGNLVRGAIVKLGGTAVTSRDDTEIVHTTDYKVMLDASQKVEPKWEDVVQGRPFQSLRFVAISASSPQFKSSRFSTGHLGDGCPTRG